MADNKNTIATAYVQILPSTQGIEGELNDALVPAAASAGASGGAAIGAGVLASLKKKAIPIAAVLASTAAIKKAGSALLGIGQEFDQMRDTIVIGTGASGDALDDLAASAENIAKTVPVSFGTAGDYVQNLNTRMGLVGKNLEAVGKRLGALANLGINANLDNLTGAFNAFGIANDDAAEKMDYLFNVSQATGIEFNSLTGIIEKNAPALMGLGFSFEEAANMAGLLDKAGMDASGTMGKLSKALVELSKPGESAAQAYQRVVSEIDAFIKAGDEAAAIDLASELFGTRGAAQFVAAVQSGAVSLDALRDSALGAGDGILATLDATIDFPQRMEIIENRAKAAFEPLGGALLEAANLGLDRFAQMLENLDPTMLEKLGDDLGNILVAAINAVCDAIEFFVNHYDQISAFADGFIQVVTFMQNPLSSLGIGFQILLTTVTNVTNAITAGLNAFSSTVNSIFSAIGQFMQNPIQNAANFIMGIPSRIIGFFSGLGSRISAAIGNIHFPTPHVSWQTLSVFGMSTPIQLPHISWYAHGGMVTDALLFGAGERGNELVWPEYQPHMQKYAAAIAQEMPSSTDADLTQIIALIHQLIDKDSSVYLDGRELAESTVGYTDALLGARQTTASRGLA